MKAKSISSLNSKSYTLIDKKQKFVLSRSNMTDSYQKSVRFTEFLSKSGVYTQPYCIAINDIHQIKQTLDVINPVDVRVFYNEIEVMDDDRKLELIRNLVILEQTHKSSTVLSAVSSARLKTLLTEQVIQDNTKALWNFHTLNNLSIDKYKKIKELLTK